MIPDVLEGYTRKGAIVVHVLGAIYTFFVIALVCDGESVARPRVGGKVSGAEEPGVSFPATAPRTSARRPLRSGRLQRPARSPHRSPVSGLTHAKRVF